jgi:rhamnosyltransferase
MMPAPDHGGIMAVVVTYNPDDELAARLKVIAPQVAGITVVDNHSEATALARLRSICSQQKYQLMENKDNLGVATALNQGIRAAAQTGSHWVVTMDQDTLARPDMIDILLETHRAFPQSESVGAIGSNYAGRQRAPEHGEYQVAKTVITAGSLIAVSAFNQIGGFSDELFIDGVDEDFCLRLRRSGYVVLRATKIGMAHPIGSQTRHRFLWRDVGVSNHSALRHYYMTRNRLLLIARHFRFEPGWCFSQLLTQMKMSILVLLFEKAKLQKFRAMLQGVGHALIGRTGKLSNGPA